MTWPFADLRPLSYEVIVADPPWQFELWSENGQAKSAQQHYACMNLEAIKGLPVGDLAQRNCLLLLWVTAPMLRQGLETLHAWRFTYKTMLAWRKTTPAGKVRMGTGYWARSMHETVLVGTIGKPSKFSAFPSLFDGLAREHSRKPDEFYALVERHTAGLRRLDLFARQRRSGFEPFGLEIDRFEPAPVLPVAAE